VLRCTKNKSGERMNLGPHAAYIWLCYATVAIVIGAMIGWLFVDGRRHERRLAELESQGVRRRSASDTAGS
jgi:heme exporter protein D